MAVVFVLSHAGSEAHGQAPAPFTNEASLRGVNFVTPFGTSAGRGIALGDLNGDGFPDLVCLGGVSNIIGMYQNDGAGRFIDRRPGDGIAALPNCSGITLADYDGDGDLDIYITRFGEANRLYRNDGNFHFTNVTVAAGVGNAGLGTGASWGDFDGDGWLDLYVCNMTSSTSPIRNSLYRNQHNGTFVDVGPSLGVVDVTGLSWQSAFFDADLDGDADLYINDDKGAGLVGCPRHNFMYRNEAGTLVDVTDASGTRGCMDAMGLAIGDVNGDAYPDMYITNTETGNVMFVSNGDGTYQDVAGPWGLRSFSTSWGPALFDYNNDGDLDLYVCNQDALNRMYVNTGAGAWLNLAGPLGVDRGTDSGRECYIVAVADLDNDGDLDMVVEGLDSPIRAYINHEGERRRWIKFRIVGEWPNTFAIGARVAVRTGTVWQYREVMGTGGFKSFNDTTVHVGLGTAMRADEVRVVWPGGRTQRVLTGYQANRTYEIVPPQAMGDLDGSGVISSADVFAFLDCFFASVDGVAPGCERGDMDSDGRMTSSDFFLLLGRLFE